MFSLLCFQPKRVTGAVMNKENQPPVEDSPKEARNGEKVSHTCPVCRIKFYHRGTYCTRAHKQKAYRERMRNETEA
jgi:hypothetical protein